MHPTTDAISLGTAHGAGHRGARQRWVWRCSSASVLSPRKKWQQQNGGRSHRTALTTRSGLPSTSINFSYNYHMSSTLSFLWENAQDMVETSTEEQQIKTCTVHLRQAWVGEKCLKLLGNYCVLHILPTKSHSNSGKLQPSMEGTGGMPGVLRSHLHIIN